MYGKAKDAGREWRIVALLVSLAGLAERAALRCFPIRLLVFVVLWRAEAVARDHVEGALEAARLGLEDPQILARQPDSAALAARFRLLAEILEALLVGDVAEPGLTDPYRSTGTRLVAQPAQANRHDGGADRGLHVISAWMPGLKSEHARPAAVTHNRPRSPPTTSGRPGRWEESEPRAVEARPSPRHLSGAAQRNPGLERRSNRPGAARSRARGALDSALHCAARKEWGKGLPLVILDRPERQRRADRGSMPERWRRAGRRRVGALRAPPGAAETVGMDSGYVVLRCGWTPFRDDEGGRALVADLANAG